MKGTVQAYAPGSIGNVGPGLDILGLAVAGAGDQVTLTWRSQPGIAVTDAGHTDLPRDPTRNTAAIAAAAVFARAKITHGATLSVRKGLPLSGGQGGSAASAVAGAVAAARLVAGEYKLDQMALLTCALEGEAAVAGRHADNVAPSLLGNLALVHTLEPMDVISITLPTRLRIVLAHPEQQVRTRDARAVLPDDIPRSTAIAQAAHVAAMVAAACRGDLPLLGRALTDLIAEPARAHLLPGFLKAKEAALELGALGASISGSGPTTFALVDSATADPDAVSAGMVIAYARAGIVARARVAEVDTTGARAW